MLLDAGMLVLIVALVAGGRLSRLRDFELRAPVLFIFAALAKVAVAILGARGSPVALHAGGLLNLAAYLLLLIVLGLNWRMWGMRIAALGVLLNFLVVAANGGTMPVARDLAERAGNQTMLRLLDSPTYISHKPITPATRLRPLADVLPLPLLLPRPRFFTPGSVGDVILTIGTSWLILSALGAFGLGPRPARDAAT
jgi:hypothetical protein